VQQGYFPESALVTVEEESASYWQKWVSNLLISTAPPPGWCGSELRDRLLLSQTQPGLLISAATITALILLSPGLLVTSE